MKGTNRKDGKEEGRKDLKREDEERKRGGKGREGRAQRRTREEQK